MSHEKLGNLQEETVPQDLDQLERDVLDMLDQQQKETAHNQRLEDSKFAAANCNKNGAPAQNKDKQFDKKRQPLSLFIKQGELQDKQAKRDKSIFLLAANAQVKADKTADAKFKSSFVTPRMLANGASPFALQLELGQIRRAKANPFMSFVRLIKGLGQGNDLAEQYVERHRPDLLKKAIKAPSA